MAIEIGGYRPGALAAIVGLHASYYARHWNFGLPFETKVGAELAEFLARHDAERDLFLVAYSDGDVVASVIIDQTGGGPQGAHLRWFIVSEEMQGKGLGADLLGRALKLLRRARLRAHLAHHLRRPRRRAQPLRAARLRAGRRGRDRPVERRCTRAGLRAPHAGFALPLTHDDSLAGPSGQKRIPLVAGCGLGPRRRCRRRYLRQRPLQPGLHHRRQGHRHHDRA